MPELDHHAVARSATNVVAFSGGPDSVCLLHQLSAARDRGPLRVVHIDHALDPDSARRARRARAIARGLGVDCEVHRIEPARRSRDGGPEAAARHARYACLQAMLDCGDHVLTAHHADDQVETVVLRLLRGAGPAGLSGMQPLRPLGPGWLGRPLLGWSRSAIVEYLARHDLEYQHDPGNRDLSLDRNYLRHEVMPVLARRWPGYRGSLLQSARWQRTAALALEHDAARQLEACSRVRGPSGERLVDLEAWLALAPEPSFAVIRAWCEHAGIETPRVRPLQAFRRQCRSAADDRQPALDWPAGRIHAWRGWLWLDVKPDPPAQWSRIWPQADCCPVPAGGALCWTGCDRTALGREWVLAPTRPAMKLRIHIDGPRRRVAELMREAGVPPWRRYRFPALHLDDRLCAIGADWLDAEFAKRMRDCGGTLEWQRRPASLLP